MHKKSVIPSPKHYSFRNFATPASLYLFKIFAAWKGKKREKSPRNATYVMKIP